MQLKKRFAFILSILLAFAFTACNTEDNDGENITTPVPQTTMPETTVPETPAQTVTYAVSFNKNADNATGATESVSCEKNKTVTLTENGFIRSGYKFSGWNTLADGKGANYSNKASFTLIKDLVLYALWTKEATEQNTGGNGSGTGSGETQAEEKGAYRSGMSIVWQDEFDSADSDGTPLLTKWGYDVGRGTSTNSDGTKPGNWGWGNGEEQWYSDNNSGNTYVSDGTLKIVAKREAAGDGATWTSGRLVTRNVYENKYGCIEMRAKISEAAGVWPAFWMLRHDIYDDGGTGWPRGGEIDIMESSTNVWGAGKVYGTLHCQAGYGGVPIWSQGMQLSSLEATWHTYAIVWNENGTISWYYDDTLLGTYTASDKNNNDVWPYDENFYIILNLAVGGGLGGAIDPNLSQATMEVDYVRWYQ